MLRKEGEGFSNYYQYLGNETCDWPTKSETDCEQEYPEFRRSIRLADCSAIDPCAVSGCNPFNFSDETPVRLIPVYTECSNRSLELELEDVLQTQQEDDEKSSSVENSRTFLRSIWLTA